MGITVTRPQKKMTDFRSSGTGKLKNPYHEERLDNPIKLVQLCTGVAITKDYGPCEMTYSRLGGFKKYSKKEGRNVKPSSDELFYFKRDINRAAFSDPGIRAFLDNHPDLKIESWQL